MKRRLPDGFAACHDRVWKAPIERAAIREEPPL
jgi:hypothetical protein